MGLALSFIICSALVVELVVPALLRSYRASEKKRYEKFALTKLRMVRKYYSELSDLTYSEIVAEYNVEALYDNIGRKPLKRLSFVRQNGLEPGMSPTIKKGRPSRIAA
jgi:hypothetical protein